ncbi:hypothetical protein H6G41_22860 [Tolypothrix sp. FACHB-123]|uniref:hypothetical protein n=1 Tax=Tolypothrix sp. FACHB-123 TaxID=2692868 RepID=UPI001688B025|nr:hypothetical protein [Tolypothrix sp. FACHB-123]MBD2357424.1 hypothetical protein [Tolypothrix sp. FACHB-123]
MEAQTITAFLKAVNEEFQLTLQTDISGDSPIAKLLEKPITVQKGEKENILYEARGSPLDFSPFNFGESFELKTIVIITVTQGLN